MSGADGDNCGKGAVAFAKAEGSTTEDLLAIDALPKPIRIVIRDAPYSYHGPELAKLVAALKAQGHSVATIVKILKAEIHRHIRGNVRACYGETHPQARISL